jgi:hypothetical protein
MAGCQKKYGGLLFLWNVGKENCSHLTAACRYACGSLSSGVKRGIKWFLMNKRDFVINSHYAP